MKKSVKMWSNFLVYTGVLGAVLSASLFLFNLGSSRVGLLIILGLLVIGEIAGYLFFSPAKCVDGISEKEILLDSVFGFDYSSIKLDGVLWEDIVKAQEVLKEYKQNQEFKWGPKNLFDILVVSFDDDLKTTLSVKHYKNTRELNFKGILRVNKTDKLKLDTLDLSNFNTDLLEELGGYSGKSCLLKVVRPIDTLYLQRYFGKAKVDCRSYIYDIVEVSEEVGV